jgi:uncharacterized membrane protein YeaQ/YmgE (transglycosylase-associated protein family)
MRPLASCSQCNTIIEERVDLLGWIVTGAVAGVVGELIIPGHNPGGMFLTLLIGMVGALLSRFVVGLAGGAEATGLSIWTLLWATVGALALIVVYRMITNNLYRP